jgi:hypothetical protein
VAFVQLAQRIPVLDDRTVDPAIAALRVGDVEGALAADELGGRCDLQPVDDEM